MKNWTCHHCGNSISDVQFTNISDRYCLGCLNKMTVMTGTFHFHAELWMANVPKDIKVLSEQIALYMNPHHRSGSDGFWDNWHIGGKYKGIHVEGYDPAEDFTNYGGICSECHGGGTIPGAVIHTCDACQGKGTEEREVGGVMYPTTCKACGGNMVVPEAGKCPTCRGHKGEMVEDNLRPMHQYDVCSYNELPDNLSCESLVIGDDIIFHNVNVKQKLRELGMESGYLVTIDYSVNI